MGWIGPAQAGIPGPKGRRLPAGLSGSHGPGRQYRSETLDGESRTDGRATADDVVRCRLGCDVGRRRAHSEPDLPRRPDASCTGGAITGITSGWDTERQRLEPDAEQSARPVLRGALDSNVEAPTRRSLTVWFTDEAVDAWAAEPRTTRGGQPWYSALAILTALTLRAVFRLAFRQTEGLIGSIIGLLGLTLRVPDHTTLSRRAATVDVPQPRRPSPEAGREAAPLHLLVDSTGLRQCGPGEWLLEKHGTRTRRSWRKLHLGVDADTGQVVATVLTTPDVDDGSQAGPLLDQVAGPVASFTGDGAYDQDGVYASVAERHPEATIIVPPRATAVPSQTAESEPTQHDRHLQHIADHGRMAWQTASGYTKRARAEAAIGRWKQVIGDRLRAHTEERRATEVDVAVHVLNRMLDLGRPNYVRTA